MRQRIERVAEKSVKPRRQVRIAIIGCGAVTEFGHLPAAMSEKIHVTALVDRNRPRAQALAARYNVPHVAEDYRMVAGEFDAAIVALPHYLHAPVSIDLLKQGIHVLVEKPMALAAAECDAMLNAAEQGRVVLAVGLMRRFQWSARLAKSILDSGLLGAIESFDIREGFVYSWPVASDFFFRKDAAGGGVLIDTGSHTLDTLLWWLGDVVGFDYFDDNYGGVEADCELRLVMANGARGTVELSRTRALRNTAIIRGQRATLEVHLHTNEVALRVNGAKYLMEGNVVPEVREAKRAQSYVDLMAAQLADWVSAFAGGNLIGASGVEGRCSIALIEACYAERRPLMLPWIGVDTVPSAIAMGVGR